MPSRSSFRPYRHAGARGYRPWRARRWFGLRLATLRLVGLAVTFGIMVGLRAAEWRAAPDWGSITWPSSVAALVPGTFGSCHIGGGINCVVDGDTFWMGGEKIRIADIDAPETHPPRCAEEARLGSAATDRLRVLLNQGPIELLAADRTFDRYGRRLAVVTRDGTSLGSILVAEGLARRWDGARRPWCDG